LRDSGPPADHGIAGAREVADRLLATFGSMLCYWYHFTQHGRRIETETDDDTVAAHFRHRLHGRPRLPLHARALDISLILYAEHDAMLASFFFSV
jgi:2-methylcitrate synthase